MESVEGSRKKSSSSNKVVIAIIVLIVVVAAAAGAILYTMNRQKDDRKIGYATEAKVMLDEDSLQAAMDEAMENARNSRIGLQYKNDAFSDDGINFACSITNSASNIYDMFLTIYADAELTDEIYMSGLVPPGSGFEDITLEHELSAGDHRVYVILTQVETDESGEQLMKNQVSHTMDFHVTG